MLEFKVEFDSQTPLFRINVTKNSDFTYYYSAREVDGKWALTRLDNTGKAVYDVVYFQQNYDKFTILKMVLGTLESLVGDMHD